MQDTRMRCGVVITIWTSRSRRMTQIDIDRCAARYLPTLGLVKWLDRKNFCPPDPTINDQLVALRDRLCALRFASLASFSASHFAYASWLSITRSPIA